MKYVRWRSWPQFLAPNYQMSFNAKPRGRAAHEILYHCATTLAERENVGVADVVVFYPMIRWATVTRGLKRWKQRDGNLDGFKGLTICPVPQLHSYCMAFKLSDVRAHRTPADPYYTTVQTPSKHRKIRPTPLYGKKESNLGKVIHD